MGIAVVVIDMDIDLLMLMYIDWRDICCMGKLVGAQGRRSIVYIVL